MQTGEVHIVMPVLRCPNKATAEFLVRQIHALTIDRPDGVRLDRVQIYRHGAWSMMSGTELDLAGPGVVLDIAPTEGN